MPPLETSSDRVPPLPSFLLALPPHHLSSAMAARRLLLRLRWPLRPRLSLVSSSSLLESSTTPSLAAAAAAGDTAPASAAPPLLFVSRARAFSSSPPSFQAAAETPGPAAVDYQSMMPEDQFHKLADNTIHDLQEKLEEYGDSLQMEGFDIDYGNQVLTLRLGDLGTYVINKQTPNRQIWLSSPVSGPSRFDWDAATNAWVYRRTRANLLQLLEKEIGELCGTPIDLS